MNLDSSAEMKMKANELFPSAETHRRENEMEMTFRPPPWVEDRIRFESRVGRSAGFKPQDLYHPKDHSRRPGNVTGLVGSAFWAGPKHMISGKKTRFARMGNDSWGKGTM